MVAYNKFQIFVQDVCNKVHNLASDTLKVALSNVAPVNTNTILSNITQITAANGYTSGGNAVTGVSSTQAGGTETLSANVVTFTASGGAMATFRYVVLYNSTPVNGNLIAWWDFGAGITLNSGDSMVVQWNGGTVSGTIFTMA